MVGNEKNGRRIHPWIDKRLEFQVVFVSLSVFIGRSVEISLLLLLLLLWLLLLLLLLSLTIESPSDHPKMAENPNILTLLTSKFASRHNGVHFFHISTSKSGPRMVCFGAFYFQMCLGPQRRALFPHLNFQKLSETDVF